MTIRQKIILWFTLFSVCIVFTLSILEYFIVNQNTFEDFYKRLEIRAIVAAKAQFEKEEMEKSAYEEIRKMHLETLPYEKEYIIKANADEALPRIKAVGLEDGFYTAAMKTGSARFRNHDIFYLGYLYAEHNNEYIVIVSAKNEYIELFLTTLRRIIIASILATMAISLLAGLVFSGVILKPLRIITQKMRNISANQLHLRLETGKGKDEISLLSDTFNNMLDRLEATFETQKNFISNASHELNTPLTSIIGESEYVLSKERNSEEYRRSLEVILKQAGRLEKITSSLLRLAQTGYNGEKQEFIELRLDEILYKAKEIADNIIPDSKVYIDLNLMPEDQNKLIVKGNPQLLELALVNIILNGCKYSMNKPVLVALAATSNNAIVIIKDEGIGIPDDEIAYIYEPFFRASNTVKFNGYGIGLPLSRNIIRMHGGQLEVTSQVNVGTKIKITLPLNIS
jgi:signal transduction histidine kinase